MAEDTAPAIAALNARLAADKLRGLWVMEPHIRSTIGGPAPGGVPYLWRWEMLRRHLIEGCDAAPEHTAGRRVLLFSNPGLARYTTPSLGMGVQLIHPGERAEIHRHTAAALRFVIDGDSRLSTTVDGTVCPMETHDLILTPGWCWHAHANDGEHDRFWIDIIEAPLVDALYLAVHEDYPAAQPPPPRRAGPNMLRFPWAEMRARLDACAADPGEVALAYANPRTGGPALTNMGCWAEMLRPGEATRPRRRTAGALYVVVEGEGRSMIGDVELAWGPNDCFVVPSWSWHHHLNGSRDRAAVLFRTDDAPLMRVIGMYREEAAD